MGKNQKQRSSCKFFLALNVSVNLAWLYIVWIHLLLHRKGIIRFHQYYWQSLFSDICFFSFFFLFTILLTLMKYSWYSKMTLKKQLNDHTPPKKSTTIPNKKPTASLKHNQTHQTWTLFPHNYCVWMATTGYFFLNSR